MVDTNDEARIKEAEKKAKFDRDDVISALNSLLKSSGGRKWVWDMLVKCHVFRSSFTGNSQTFFNEGERNVGLSILNDVMEASPDVFAQMQKEFGND